MYLDYDDTININQLNIKNIKVYQKTYKDILILNVGMNNKMV